MLLVETPLSFGVCSNRPHNMTRVRQLLDVSTSADEVILVADLRPDHTTSRLLHDLEASGARVLRNDTNMGLSYSRNLILATCSHRHLVYIDDDLEITSPTVEAIRDTVTEGAAIVGVRLEPAFEARIPWWLTGGQYHYLGVHHNVAQARTWGACMAIDAQMARSAGLTFRSELGRHGSGLQSGDDTTFLRKLRALGATERFFTEASAVHHVGRERTRLRYLLRRAWWQGRSEARRGAACTSIRKEWGRATAAGPAAAAPARRYLLSTVYVGAVISGGATESMLRIVRGKS